MQRHKNIISALLIGAILSATGPLRAQDVTTLTPEQLRLSGGDSLRQERRDFRRGAAKIAVGTALLAPSALLFSVGGALGQSCIDEDDWFCDSGGAGGAVFAGLAMSGLSLFSIVRGAKQIKKAKRVQRERLAAGIDVAAPPPARPALVRF